MLGLLLLLARLLLLMMMMVKLCMRTEYSTAGAACVHGAVHTHRARENNTHACTTAYAAGRMCTTTHATGLATTRAPQVGTMGYMARMGLWGPASPFADFKAFVDSMKNRGVSFMEVNRHCALLLFVLCVCRCLVPSHARASTCHTHMHVAHVLLRPCRRPCLCCFPFRPISCWRWR